MRYLFQLGRLGAGHVPVIFTIVFVLMLGITYCFAVYRGDVDPLLPYISATGSNRPESCVFSMFLNVCSMLTALIITLRYDLIAELNRNSNVKLKYLNKFAYIVGLVGSFGMFLVANFQETAVVQIHLTGALLSFGFGGIYMILHAVISHMMVPLFASRRAAYIRSVYAGIGFVAFFTALVFGILASNKFHSYHPDAPTPRPWSRKTSAEGYELHCISAVAEWCLAIINTLYLLSYSRDFETIQVKLSVNPLVGHLDQSPDWNSESNFES